MKSSLPSHVSQHLLIGSTSQAIEFWPGPSDLRSWDWDQYVKYVTTSLDSFGPRLSQLALRVYSPASDVDAPALTPVTAAAAATTTRPPVVFPYSTDSQSESSNFPSISASHSPPSSSSVSASHQNAMSPGTRSESEARQMRNSGSGVRPMNESQAAFVRKQESVPGEGSALRSKIDLTSKSMTTSDTAVESKADSSSAGPKPEAGMVGGKSVNNMTGVSSLTKDSMPGSSESDANSSQQRLRRSISSLGDSISMRKSQPHQQQQPPLTPEFLYSTMVSDVRQTCPINKLSHLIKNSTTTASVHRYVITAGPSTSVSTVAAFAFK